MPQTSPMLSASGASSTFPAHQNMDAWRPALGTSSNGKMAAASLRSICVVILILSAEPSTIAQPLPEGLDELAVVGDAPR